MRLHARDVSARFVVAFLLSLALAGVSQPAAAAEALRVEPFPGYCSIDPSNPAEHALLDSIAHTQRGINEVVQVQVACGPLERARAGEKARLYPNVVVLVQLDETGKPRQIDMERRAFHDEVEKALAGQQGKDLLSRGAEASRERQLEMLKGSGAGAAFGGPASQIHFAGPVTRDDTAVYVTSMQRHWVGKETYSATGASATSTVNGAIITIGLFRIYDGSQTFDPQIEEVRSMMRAFIALNEAAP